MSVKGAFLTSMRRSRHVCVASMWQEQLNVYQVRSSKRIGKKPHQVHTQDRFALPYCSARTAKEYIDVSVNIRQLYEHYVTERQKEWLRHRVKNGCTETSLIMSLTLHSNVPKVAAVMNVKLLKWTKTEQEMKPVSTTNTFSLIWAPSSSETAIDR